LNEILFTHGPAKSTGVKLIKLKNENLSIGLYEKALPKNLSWEERLTAARDAGYSFMEISIDETDERVERLKWDRVKKENLREIAENTGIPISTMCLSGNRRFPIGSSFGDIQRKGMEMISDAIWFASHLGIRIVQLAGYDVVVGEKSTELSRETFGINLKRSLNLAASLGVMLAIENVDSDFGDSLDKIMPYIREINSPWLQIYPDFGNLRAMGYDFEKQLKSYCGHIAAIHVKDTCPGIVRNVAFGEGTVDFLSAFNTLKSIGFNGPFLLEMWADNKKDNYEIIRIAREWVTDQMKKAGYE
jgi:L-ribulose-5-phosphate 3-epimerase